MARRVAVAAPGHGVYEGHLESGGSIAGRGCGYTLDGARNDYPAWTPDGAIGRVRRLIA